MTQQKPKTAREQAEEIVYAIIEDCRKSFGNDVDVVTLSFNPIGDIAEIIEQAEQRSEPKHAAPIGVGLSDEEIFSEFKKWMDLKQPFWEDVDDEYLLYKDCFFSGAELLKVAQTTSIPRATLDEVVEALDDCVGYAATHQMQTYNALAGKAAEAGRNALNKLKGALGGGSHV